MYRQHEADGTITFRASHDYDSLGNRFSMTKNGVTTSYAYDPTALNELASVSGKSYDYDANGNLIKDEENSVPC
ncbi:hypothetical protein [Aquibacillus salsiterrae]|uniref:RHS repeat protein n=1 Tax=Aquibacillus salsiterrae TaxID=2950439 RepID=A0A9X3WEQ8_9BACI|nr:hypothetical protein [Aquibacillus salsiterrae]MDC3418422.1 hypothetical protein [Aquibacillus salsiterrae]